ncbi:MAG: ribosomal-protein-alanine N-acetyltransferase [Chromatiales bacterium 21-64-14]|nr:MAG: ribosomal-protein-alanine N-acetyltransferase [Chromatiales bacterium 21-64-14]HQU14783.1 ribosomal protein S18-alanine N-acetyltransferase [Gammaproteobacteria bacterium]
MSAILNDNLARFRPMRENDLAAVMDIESGAYDFPWSEGIFRDCLRVGYCCWLYEEAGEVLAYGVMSVGYGEAHVLNLCVRPESRQRGIGRRMLSHLLDLARRHHADTALLEVRPTNHAALVLYTGLGFNQVGLRRAYYPAARGREDALILAYRLR